MMLCIKAFLRGWGWRARLSISLRLDRRGKNPPSIRPIRQEGPTLERG
jgi:hypothetical protein